MTDDLSPGGETPSQQEPDAEFAQQARAAGLVLPTKVRGDPWGALVVVVALIVLTAGIGEVTGWVNLRTNSTSGGNFETQTCTGSPVQASGVVSSAYDPAFAAWLATSGQQLSQAVGGCFTVQLGSNPGDGYLPMLGGANSEFAVSYAPPTAGEIDQLPFPVVIVPVALSAVAVIYNLPGVPSGLNLSGSVLAGIYNGTVTSWDNPAIAQLNPNTNLSGLPAIAPFQLAGTSVSNEVFSAFLAASSPSWNAAVGSGPSVPWPAGASVGSDAAMVSGVASTVGSIGYLDLFGSPPTGVGCAQIEDAAGDFASPGAVASWVAAESLANSSEVASGNWSNFSLIHATEPGSYPLAALAYLGIFRDLGVAYGGTVSLENASWLLTYVYWLTGAASVAPLPGAYQTSAVNALNNETYDGTTIVHLENENGEGNETGGETGEF
ncbi:MAG: substrate-binding domain-containing protein [Thermoplasmata archaeon]